MRAQGGNPCLEQTLETYELCCLVETFPNNHENLEEYLDTLKHAYLYAKTVTLGSYFPFPFLFCFKNDRVEIIIQ